MQVHATTPTRIDLAGGTLDISPLYLFLDGGITVNLGIDLRCRAQITIRDDAAVHLISDDLGASLRSDSLQALPVGQDLDLIARAVKFYQPAGGVEVRTKNTAPPGSGLGASSSLLMALSGALNHLTGATQDLRDLIDWGANLEAQSLKIPTGKQDYFAAIYGGLNAIHFSVKGVEVEHIPLTDGELADLAGRLVVCFTGVSHFSGTNNWLMLRRFIDQDRDTMRHLARIKATAAAMRDLMVAKRFDDLGPLVAEEWKNRQQLAEGVSTPLIDHLVEAARQAGASGSKICGAGGGGCLLTIVPPGRKAQVETALSAAGASVLPVRPDVRGLIVEVGVAGVVS